MIEYIYCLIALLAFGGTCLSLKHSLHLRKMRRYEECQVLEELRQIRIELHKLNDLARHTGRHDVWTSR
jgi:hypothetical protein